MTLIQHEFQAKCDPGKIWDLLSDLEAVTSYNPTIKAVRVLGTRHQGKGAERECDLVPKGKVKERVIAWEPGRAVGLEVTESDWPITFMRWVTRIEPSAGGSKISQDLEYGMKFGLLGLLLDALAMRRNVKKNVGDALKGMIAAAEAH